MLFCFVFPACTEVLCRRRKILAPCLGILNTRQYGQCGDNRLFCRKNEHFCSAMLGIYNRLETFSRTGVPVTVPYSSHTTSSTHGLLDGDTGALLQPVSLAWGKSNLLPLTEMSCMNTPLPVPAWTEHQLLCLNCCSQQQDLLLELF